MNSEILNPKSTPANLDSLIEKFENPFHDDELVIHVDYGVGIYKGLELLKTNSSEEEYIQIEYNWHHLIKNVNLYQFSKILPNYEVFKIMPFFNEIYRIDPMKPENNYFNYSNIVFKIKNGRKK